MEKLRKALKKVLGLGFLQELTTLDGDSARYHNAARQFASFSNERKQDLFRRMSDKLKSRTHTDTHLNILLLMECLVATEEIPFLELYDSQLDDKTSPRDLHLKKGIAAEMNLLEYYAKYINNKKRQEMMSTLTPPQFKEQTSYCRLALQIIIQFLKIDFVFHYLLLHDPVDLSKSIVHLATTNILKTISQDLRVLNRFMAKHQSLILTFTQDAFEVNEIYEKMIVAEREISKLEHLNKLVGESLYFEKYSLEVERNREIERHMLTRKQEYVQWKMLPKEQNCIKTFSTPLSTEQSTMLRLQGIQGVQI